MAGFTSLTGTGYGPSWVKITKTFVDFQEAGTTSVVELFTANALDIVDAVFLKLNTLFATTEGELSGVNVSVGTTETAGLFMADVSVGNTLGAHFDATIGAYNTASGPLFVDHGATAPMAVTVSLTITPLVAEDLTDLTAGEIEIWVLINKVG